MKIIISILALAALTLADENNLEKVLNDGNDYFTARMFSEVVKANPGKSVIVSPFSVMSPLAQLSLASTGESQAELLRAIGLPDENTTKAVFTNVNRQFRFVKGVELKIANKVYVAENYHLNDNFAALSKEVFNSEVQNINFIQNDAAAKTMNTWVEEHTNNRIKNLIDPQSLTRDTRSVLVNAIYYKGSWKNKFNKDLTQDRPFHVDKKTTIQVPTMYKKDDILYGESAELDAKLIKLPYEGDESYLTIVLPNDVEGINSLEEKLKDPKMLENAEKKMFSTEVKLYLPKFKIETTTDLKSVLQKMNVKRLFDSSQACLNNLLKEQTDNLYVSEAIQKAFIEVNEEGAEAAAANVFIGLGALPSFKIQNEFRADRPFYFELKYKSMTLFNGMLTRQ